MLQSTLFRSTWLAAACIVTASTALAESVWVSDQFEIMLRTGPSNSNAIERMLNSGTELEVLERDSASGYSRVKTQAGTEGWVLSRYLMREAPAREQLEQLTGQLTNASDRGASLGSQLEAIRAEQRKVTEQNRQLEADRDKLQVELADITRKSANVLSIDSQNKNLHAQLSAAQVKVDTLTRENETLKTRNNHFWFVIGAVVLSVGVLFGLIVPRLKFRRRSRYDRL